MYAAHAPDDTPVALKVLRDEWAADAPGPLRDVVVACLAKDEAARPSMRDVLL